MSREKRVEKNSKNIKNKKGFSLSRLEDLIIIEKPKRNT